jgi:hypothetical protein
MAVYTMGTFQYFPLYTCPQPGMIAERIAAFLGLCLGIVSTFLVATLPWTNREVSRFMEEESSCADKTYPQQMKKTIREILYRKII